MSYGGGTAELDPVSFTDEAFPSFMSLNAGTEVQADAADQGDRGRGGQKARKTKNAEIATDVLYYADVETNTKHKKVDAEIQVDKYINLGAVGDNDDEGYYDEDERIAQKLMQPAKVEYDEEAVAAWLTSIFPKVSQLLETNFKAKTFDNYEVFWEDERAQIDLWHKLSTDFDFKEANKATQRALTQMKGGAGATDSMMSTQRDEDDDWGGQSTPSQSSKNGKGGKAGDDHYQAVSIAWSSNGSTLAVAYGKTNHEAWCEHHSSIATWGIFRREFDPKKPNLIIEVQNCLTTIEFHPSDPSILAGGTMNGEIYLWNISVEKGGEDPFICNSAIDEYYHREAVTKLIWIKYESLTSMAFQYCLLSVSTDAKILVWRVNDKLRYPAKGHLLARKKDGELATVGGTSFCKVQGAGDDQTFIVGTEGGSIFKCSIQEPQDKDISHFFEQQTSGLRWKQEAIGLLSNLPSKAIMDVKKKVERYILDKGGEKDIWAPTVYHAKPDVKMIFSVPFNANYEKHLGPVLGLSSSPFVKRLFLSCSSDGSVRLYDLLGHRPVMVFEPGYNEYLLDVQWSPFRPAVFATVSNLGHVYLYDLSESRSSPIHTLKDPDLDSVTSAQRVAQSIQFNPRQRQFMAIAYHDGHVRIYQLSYVFANQQKNELKVLQSFLEEKGAE